MLKINEKESRYIYILKFFAVISIVSAHCTLITNKGIELNIVFRYILDIIGSIGVPIFFIISGYFFKIKHQKNCFKSFISKKMFTLILPWGITGTIVFLYIVLRKGGLNIYNWILFLLGQGSYLYYMTILFILYICFNYFTKKILNIVFVMSLLSIIMTSKNMLNFINPYLNPLNFYIYFFIGYMICYKNLEYILVKFCTKYRIIIIFIFLLSIYLIYIFNFTYGYWGESTIVFQVISILLLIGIANSQVFLNNKYFIYIGKQSFAIYLLHIPIAGLISFIFNKLNLWYFTLLRPICVIFILTIFIYFLKYKILQYDLSKKIYLYLGIK